MRHEKDEKEICEFAHKKKSLAAVDMKSLAAAVPYAVSLLQPLRWLNSTNYDKEKMAYMRRLSPQGLCLTHVLSFSFQGAALTQQAPGHVCQKGVRAALSYFYLFIWFHRPHKWGVSWGGGGVQGEGGIQPMVIGPSESIPRHHALSTWGNQSRPQPHPC